MDAQAAQKVISEKIETAHKLIKECEELALEHGLTFHLEPAYGMGGYFDGTSKHDYLDSHWHPSSHSC